MSGRDLIWDAATQKMQAAVAISEGETPLRDTHSSQQQPPKFSTCTYLQIQFLPAWAFLQANPDSGPPTVTGLSRNRLLGV